VSGTLPTLRGLPQAAIGLILDRLVEPVMGALQRLIGVRRMPWLFLAPNLAFFGLFVFAPLAINVYFSLTGGPRLELAERSYVGADHYQTLFDCTSFLDPSSCRIDRFWVSVRNTLVFVALQVCFMVLVSLATALVLNRRIVLRGFFRAAFFFPVLLSPVVVALVWKWILQRDGLLNAAMVGLGGERMLFFVDPHWAMFWAVFVSIWAHMGFYTLIVLAGLQAIPTELYEAAEMDGTPAMRVLWRITLPLLWPNLIVVIVLALIKGVQTFDEIFVLTGGGPGTATYLIVQFIYETGFGNQTQNFGLAAAASILLGVMLVILTFVQFRLTRERAP
jgi:alpha-1,4-digalacturonate transport system permease protein